MYQDNSNTGFFSPNSNTFQASYIGLRLNYALPDASKYLQKRNLQTAAAIAEENAKHNLLQENNQNQQLKLEYQKAIDSYIINQKIAVLKMDTYTKNLDIYHQDLISLDNLMISFNEKLNSELNLQVIATTISYLTTKINLNNTIQ
jgi:OMF family outer membrane factor